MNTQIATVEATAVLSRASVASINCVAGQVFDNGAIKIEFHGVHVDARSAKKRVMFQISHQGIESQGIVSVETVQRMLAVDIHYLEPEYVSYLLSKKSAKYGISGIRYEETLESVPQPLIDVSFYLGEFTLKGAMSVPTLCVDDSFLRSQKQVFRDDLRLSVSWVPFVTSLYAEEITALTAQDLVLVYPK
ncbi:TPA: hypothetical protein KD884_000688 [Vibrio parahaemolyticus]|nr:hypothetical protein [Vibrio parahaemolyticus]ELY5143086.1 hypothetical protein [Vibrio vulnificus]HBC3956454.1 hypothetical protein [Vibrio parahaemolyticus]